MCVSDPHQDRNTFLPRSQFQGRWRDQGRTLGDNLSAEEADVYALVLAAARIDYRFRKTGWGWSIEVPEPDADRAWTEIRRFVRENPPGREVSEPPAAISGIMPGILAALILLAFHLATTRHGSHESFILQAGASAEHILRGEYWRTVTALTLHADAKHLAGNMLATAVFGTLLGRRVGTGAAWMLILLAGAGGNLANAWLHQAQHLSIGASTAVFGAVGLLGGVRMPLEARIFRTGMPGARFSGWRSLILPLGAALGLLAMLGSDVQTDLGAHLFGCLCGLVLGAAYALRFPRPLDQGQQMLFSLAALSLLAGSWWGVGTLF